MYPFIPYLENDSYGRSTVHALFQFTGNCPGFYLEKSLETMMPTLKEYSTKIYDYTMAYVQTEREKYCVVGSVDLNKIPNLND
jgi:uncharacterized protein